MKYYFLFFTAFLLFSCQQKTNSVETSPPSDNNNVFFKNIHEGDTLDSPFIVEMGVNGMKIKPAGELEAGTGHHHIIIDNEFIKLYDVIPMDTHHLHYGKGDTTATMTLETGDHILTLQFANGMHMSYGEQYSNSINIYVK